MGKKIFRILRSKICLATPVITSLILKLTRSCWRSSICSVVVAFVILSATEIHIKNIWTKHLSSASSPTVGRHRTNMLNTAALYVLLSETPAVMQLVRQIQWPAVSPLSICNVCYHHPPAALYLNDRSKFGVRETAIYNKKIKLNYFQT